MSKLLIEGGRLFDPGLGLDEVGQVLIEDDRNVHGLIEKIFPQGDLRVIKALPRDGEGAPGEEQGLLRGGCPSSPVSILLCPSSP